MLSKHELASLETVGLCEGSWLSEDLLTVAVSLGRPVPDRVGGPLVQTLVPRAKEQSKSLSLSGVYGKGAFPFHTDGAHHRIPPRYVLLRIIQGEKSARPTQFSRFDDLGFNERQTSVLRRAVWVVRPGRQAFYSSVLSRRTPCGPELIRYDPGCMTVLPEFSEADEIMSEAVRTCQPIVVDWQMARTVVFDNWRLLHARPPAPRVADDDRILQRVLVSKDS